MKLGFCYMVFDGEELLEFAINNIRKQVDYISVTYQTTSYFGNPCTESLVPTLERLKSVGLIDELIFFDTDLSLHHKENELKLRNLGLEYSRKNGCTHHASLDVDEFYKPEELQFVKSVMEEDYDLCLVPIWNYYKDPTYLVMPQQKLAVTFIHPVANSYDKKVTFKEFPHHLEPTRKLAKYNKCKVFTKEEIVQHHMSYVRKDIRRKFQNNDNKQFYNLKEFYETFDNYKLGERVCLLPEYLNRKTIQVENTFGIFI